MEKILKVHTINQHIVESEYAVRGAIVMRAEEHAKMLELQKKEGQEKRFLPFDEIVYCNIGNPQSLKQPPLTYFRQYLSLLQYPTLMAPENEHIVSQLYPKDVLERARKAMPMIGHSVGAYTHSQGLPFVRRSIAEFIERRDGFPCDPNNIFLYDGASPAVQSILKLLIRKPNDGIMIPIPQYPLYSATVRLLNGCQVHYYLNEESDWSLSVDELKRSYEEALKKDVEIRALVIINPGNPTGQVLTEDNMKQIVQFCHEKRLVLMADEVYQENVYIKERKPFVSFKKVLKSMGEEYNDFELFSFHSISKGFVGECGQRGGYLEAVNIDADVRQQLYKVSSISLCPNVSGQLLMEVMVNPPQPGQQSYDTYVKERDAIYDSLKRRAEKLVSFLNTLEGVRCNPAEGAMYAFPQITIPPRAVEEAKKLGKKPDEFYAISLLDAAGVVVVPGSGFGQKDGTWHFRTTFLPPENQIENVLGKVAAFHSDFMNKWKWMVQ